METRQSIRVRGSHVQLVQAVCTGSSSFHTIIKAVFMGVKEQVKAVCGDLVARKTVMLEHDDIPRLYPNKKLTARMVISQIRPTDYAIGTVFYPAAMTNIVTGTPETEALHALRVFQREYGDTIPILNECAGILWELSHAQGYAAEVVGVGLEKDEKVYILDLPTFADFEQHLLARLPDIYSLAQGCAKEIHVQADLNMAA